MIIRVLGFLIALCISGGAFAQSVPQAFDMLKPAENGEVVMSADGTRVALVAAATDRYCFKQSGAMRELGDLDCAVSRQRYRTKHTIFIYDLETSQTLKSMPLPEDYLVSWIDWVNNDRLLAAIHKPQLGKRYGGVRIASIPVDTQDYTFLFQDREDVLRANKYMARITDFLPDDRNHVLLPAKDTGELDLWKVNVVSGTSVKVASGKKGTFRWFTNAKGEPALRFDCVGVYCQTLKVFHSGDGITWDFVKSFPIKPLQARYDYEFWPVAASPNPNQFYIYADRDDEVSAAIKLYDINENRVVKTMFHDPNWDVDAVFIDTYTHDYLGVQYNKDTLTYEMKDADIQAKIDTLIKQFGGKSNVDIQQFNMDSQSALVYVSAPNNPGEYFHYDLNTETLSFLFPRRPSLDGLLLTETDALSVATRDGTELRAYLTRPEGASADKPLPLIVLPHDGPEERDFYDYNSRVQYFANRGYQVLQVNFRGSSGYGNAFTEAGFGEWGGVIQTDLMDAVQHLYDQGIAAPNNSCIVGIGSFGGFAALSAAAFTPDMFACVVAEGGAADLTGVMKETGKNYTKQSAAYEYWVKFIGDPNGDKDRLDAASPINNAANIQAPIFFSDISTSAFSMNGTNSLYTMFQSDKMMRALKKNNKTFSEIKQRDLPHEKEPTLENDLYAWQRIEAFLAEHLTQ